MPFTAVSTGVGLLGGLFGAKKKNDQAKAQADAYNKYLGNYQSGQHDYLNYLNGAPNPTETSNSSGNSVTNSHQVTDQTSNPFVTSEFSPLVGMARNIIQQRLAGPSSMPAGYAQSQIRGINDASSGARAAAGNQAARYGLSGPQAAALSTPIEMNRTNQIADAQAKLPLMERQMRNEDLGLASDIANTFGKGQQSHGETRGNSVTNSNSNSTSTGSKPFASMAAFLPPGPNAPNPTGGGLDMLFGGLGGAMDGGLGDLIGKMFKKKKAAGGSGGYFDNTGFDPFGGGLGFESQDSGSGGGFPGFSSMTRPF